MAVAVTDRGWVDEERHVRDQKEAPGARRGSILFILYVLLMGMSGVYTAADHPTLVDAGSSQCATCHEALVSDRDFVHPPAAEDCSVCHEVSVSESGTIVQLGESEPSLCLMCHDELSSAVEGELEAPHAPVVDSCTTCHDPHAAREASLLHSAMPELCADCHDLSDLGQSHGNQLTDAVDCSSCHGPHGTDNPSMLAGKRQHRPFADGSCQGCHRDPFGSKIRLRARGERLCSACHAGIAKPPSGGMTHGALAGVRGRAGCLSCHDPHMSERRALLVESGPALCESCHEDVTALATASSGHAAAADDCGTCHLPHTSDLPRLLTAKEGELCQSCHDYEDEDLVAAHLGAPLESRRCLSCHDPHGSESVHLLAGAAHPPVLDGCDLCHEGSWNELVEDGESALCTMCHDDVEEAASQAPVPHPALEMVACVECHNPHASAQEHLVRLPGGGECAPCHEEQAASEGEVAHGVIGLLGCRACHEPHGGGKGKLLRAEGDELCLACHDGKRVKIDDDESVTLLGRFQVEPAVARRAASLRLSADGQRDHPVIKHRARGTPTEMELARSDSTFRGELTCMTCHDPHKGPSSLLLRWGAVTTMDSCAHCHPK